MAAVVRRVYRNGSCPRLGVLVPEFSPDEEEGVDHLALVHVELPYMEDVREYQFAPVHSDKVRPSDAQLSAVDGLIGKHSHTTSQGWGSSSNYNQYSSTPVLVLARPAVPVQSQNFACQ